MTAHHQPRYTVVIPTIGRPALHHTLRAVDSSTGPPPVEIIVADDRRQPAAPLDLPPLGIPVRIVRSGGRGPAAARNAGWHCASTEWIAFLDDDVIPGPGWCAGVAADLAGLPQHCAGSAGRIEVPLPADRKPTDAERGTAGLASARWITADIAYRRAILAELGGFDERFPRAFREDADLGLRVWQAGYDIVTGTRRTVHPPARGSLLSSVRAQAGNADNALMRRKHGPAWRSRIGEGPSMLRHHLAITAAGALAVGAALARQRVLASVSAAAWLCGTTAFALQRITPGPRTPAEVTSMVVSSALIPPAACAHRVRGAWQARRAIPAVGPHGPRAVLFDRDDTLIRDVPYLADPHGVRPVPGAIELLDRLRGAGVRIGVVSNQSGIGRGLLTQSEVDAVNHRVDELLGPFDTWQVCPHGPAEGCRCRKPAPGMVLAAARELGVRPENCVVIGDIGADVEAALAAGARAVLVPTAKTHPAEIRRAKSGALVAPDLASAVALALAGAR